MYTYTPLSKIKTVQSIIKYNILTQVTKEVKKKKNYMYRNKNNKIQHRPEINLKHAANSGIKQ